MNISLRDKYIFMIILDEIACYFASARASFTTTHNSGVYYLKRQGNLET